MDELPQAIQNEIWEYVRGNRAYWKQHFQPILKVVKFINAELIKQVDTQCRHADVGTAGVSVGHIDIGLRKWEWGGDTVARCDRRTHEVKRWRGLEFEEAVKLFYEKVENEAGRLSS